MCSKNPSLFRLSVQQYHQIIRAAILTEDDPVELLDGLLVKKKPHNPPHDAVLSRLNRRFAEGLNDDWLIRNQCAITLTKSEPEPDLPIVTDSGSRYFDHHPGPSDVALIVEVSNATLDADRNVKGRIYARERLPIYWIVNLEARQIEVYSSPRRVKSPGYRELQVYPDEGKVPIQLSGKTIGHVVVKDILPTL